MKTTDKNAAKWLSRVFSLALVDDIGVRFVRKVNELNTVEDGTCASHNYCDANLTMLVAFEEAFKREIDLDSQADMDLWNEAWSIAKQNKFYLNDIH